MTVAGPGGNRNSKNLPIGPGGRPWSFDLFDCFGDAGTCILSWFCSCVVYGQNKRRCDHLAAHGTADPHADEIISPDCLFQFFLLYVGCGCILPTTLRTAIRERYNIEGSVLTDCLTATCCHCCQLTQASRELELEELSLGGTHGGMMSH
jgi:Cys-rich protein (TIGR01571 family)